RLWLLASNPAEVVGIDLSDPGNQRHIRLNADHSTDLAVGAGYLWVTLSDADRLSRITLDGGARTDYPTGSTLTRINVRTGRAAKKEIPVPLNPYDVAAYDDAIWVTSLSTGKVT